jgi:carotenoid cleavage dioxygenase-like enzyme
MAVVHDTARSGAELGFTNAAADEVVLDDLELTGTLPEWLAGSLLRTGPARWDLGAQTVEHWFDGLAQLHRFTFADGRVSYGSRFLRSRAFEHAERTGRLGFREFATDPCRSAFKRVVSLFDPDITDNGAVNVTRLGEKYLALTETPLPVAFDPRTLEAHGVEGRPPVDIGSAHPHHDPERGLLVSHGTYLKGRTPGYALFTQRDPSHREVFARFPVRHPAYHHSFGLTHDHAVLAEAPFTLTSPLKLALGGRPFIEHFTWHPDRPARFLVAERETGRRYEPWTAPAFFCFHHVNAFRDGGDLVVDLLAFEDPSVIDALALHRLRAGEPVPLPRLHRYRLPLDRPGTHVEPRVLGDVRLELPRIDYRRCNGRPYTTVFGAGGEEWFDRIVRVDVTTGEHTAWHEPGTFPGEPVFVGRPDATEEADGVLLSVLLEPERGASALLVLDARTLTELARARVPHHIPFGFHGQHFPAA